MIALINRKRLISLTYKSKKYDWKWSIKEKRPIEMRDGDTYYHYIVEFYLKDFHPFFYHFYYCKNDDDLRNQRIKGNQYLEKHLRKIKEND